MVGDKINFYSVYTSFLSSKIRFSGVHSVSSNKVFDSFSVIFSKNKTLYNLSLPLKPLSFSYFAA